MSPLLDTLVFSNLSVAATASALSAAASLALGASPAPVALALAFCGTFVVYNVDRLRDLPRDRETAPARSRFVERHQRALVGATGLAGAASVALAVVAGPRAIALLTPVLLAGLLHRRLKRYGWWKPLYVSASWTAVVVGLPALLASSPRHVTWVCAVVASTLVANVVASSLRDAEAPSARFGAAVPLRIARSLAALGAVIGALAPPSVRPLAAVPLATLFVLVPFRADERYGLVVVDGALLCGALLALPLLA